MGYYKDLREYIKELERKGKLQRIKKQVGKDTELAPLYWLQYRGLPEDQWKSFLFENVVDVKGKKYGSVLLGPYASSREILAMGMMCKPNEINEKWCRAYSNPINPILVEPGPVQEVVIKGEDLEKSGLEQLPAINEVPGFTSVLRTTTQIITKDPETGCRNVGCYAGHFLGNKNISGISRHHQGYMHWQKYSQKGMPMPAAIVIGATPNIAIASAAPVDYGVDELAIAGGIAGEPVELVRCKTIDMEVPSTAEIVIEGEFSTDCRVPCAAVSDYPGYVDATEKAVRHLMNVTCITHRQNPLFTTTTVGYPPNDCAILSTITREVELYRYLKYENYVPGLLDVAFPLAGGGHNFVVVQIKKVSPWQPWQVLNAIIAKEPGLGKLAIVVDEDIDPRDESAVNWALAFSMQPHRDIRIVTHRVPGLDPSAFPPTAPVEERYFPSPSGASAMLIDATRKWPCFPIGLPKKEFMEEAIKIWEEEGLPNLKLKPVWHGYHLGRWTEDCEENAQLVLRGEYDKVGEKLKKNKVKIS